MQQLIVNFSKKREIGQEVECRANAFYFVDSNLVKTLQNILVNDEQVERLEEIAKNPENFDVISELNGISHYVSPAKTQLENIKKHREIIAKFSKIDSNYAISSAITYKGIAIPEPILEVMLASKTEKEMLAIHRFHLKCLSNPNANSVKDLFHFINKSKLIITPSGNFVTFRRIVCLQKPTSIELYNKINDTFNQLFVNGKSVDKAEYVVANDTLRYAPGEEGAKSIREIRDSITSLQGKFTDNHSKTFDFRIGNTYVEKNFDSNHNNTCSRGLHSGSFDYVQSNTWLGEQMVYCIVNPTKVVAVSDAAMKVRSSELYFAGLINEDFESFKAKLENGVIDFDYEDTQFEENYQGSIVEYNQVEKKEAEDYELYSEDEYFDNELEDYDYCDEDEEKLSDDDFAYGEGYKDGFEKASKKFKSEIEYYKQKIQNRLNNNGKK